ncbi:hypothetical protein [Pseudanabaena sp. UWO310]|uniref:hypothetical protein n=1 Tax=Pseudanabaena sp. UWO310 TaxID=2480795 RepID=UPI0011591A87|nr:hypothetical protein [Pseudanabaena sp. UWO310]TYQ31807.1 hypothetical protein PseudUWO310_01165 [Pseudanabaena sp. UWO310]
MAKNPIKKDSKNVLTEWLTTVAVLAVIGFIIISVFYGFFIIATQGFGGLWTVAMSNPWIGIPWALIITAIVIFMAMAGQ